MKIVAVRSFIKFLKLTKPYSIAYETFSDVELVFFEIELANGLVGIGSASPAEEVVGESPQQTLQSLQSDFVQQLIGRDIRHFRQILFEACQYFGYLPGTLAAIDLALHDVFCKYLDIPVVDFYGRKFDGLPTSVTIGIKGVDETLEEAKEYLELGFSVVKLKTGINYQEDLERVRALRKTFGRDLVIRVDANQGYNLETLMRWFEQSRDLDIELIEQPLKVGEEALLQQTLAYASYIVADESLKDAKYALRFAQKPQIFGIYNIKLMKCGGILPALEIAQIAKNADINIFWGCNDESISSISAALHTAYACPNTKYLDLDGSFDLAEDLVKGGFQVQNGKMFISNRPGFGFDKL